MASSIGPEFASRNSLNQSACLCRVKGARPQDVPLPGRALQHVAAAQTAS